MPKDHIYKSGELKPDAFVGTAHGILVQETPADTTMVDERVVLAEVKPARSRGGVKAQR